jgi:hypothetical protein
MDSRVRKTRGVLFGQVARVALVGVTAALVIAACAERHQSALSTRTTTTVEQHVPLPPPEMVAISIVNLHDEPAANPGRERVVGTIINQGDKPVSRLSIRVEALDDSGNVVDSTTTPPLAQTIDPFGGQATFEASMPRNSSVTTYHAVVIAR